MPHSPRQTRDLDRARRAGLAARRRGVSALDAALAQIDAAFDESAATNAFKLRIERFLALGPQHRAVRARFGARAQLLIGRSLDAAIAAVERWWRDERKAFQIAAALGRGDRLSLDVLAELRLILRLTRFKRMHGEFGQIVATVCGGEFAVAAE